MRRTGTSKRVLDHLARNPNCTRADLMEALGLNTNQTSQILWRLKADRKVECKFAGRFSTWDIVREKRPVNSVFDMLGVE
jgi:DNA-binding IclR family transcriptional regulator